MNPKNNTSLETHDFSYAELNDNKKKLLEKIKEFENLDLNSSKKYLDNINKDFSEIIKNGEVSFSEALKFGDKLLSLTKELEIKIVEKESTKGIINGDIGSIKKKIIDFKTVLTNNLAETSDISDSLEIKAKIEEISNFISKVEALESEMSSDKYIIEAQKQKIFLSLKEYSKGFYIELNNSLDFSKLKEFLVKIDELGEEYKKERKIITEAAIIEKNKEKEILLKENSHKFSDIVIDGGKSKEEILSDIDSYVEKIDLDKQAKELLKGKLISIVENSEEAKEIGLGEIDTYFNGLLNNLEKVGDGSYQLTIQDGEKSQIISFKDKEEAIDFLVDMKSKAEFTFQSYIRTGLEAIANLYIGATIGLGKNFIENEVEAFNVMKNNFETSDWWYFAGSFLVLGVWIPLKTTMMVSIFYAAHTGVAESVYRRLKDPFINNSEKYQMKDYLRISTAMPDLDTPEGKDYIEVKQRSLIIELLKEKLDTDYDKGTKAYIEFDKNIKRIEAFKLNRNPTFYYLANKLVNGGKLGFKSNFGKGLGYNLHTTFLKGAKLYYPKIKMEKGLKLKNRLGIGKWEYEPSQKIARKVLDSLEENNIEKINDGIGLFFKDKKVSLDRTNTEQIEIKVEGGENKTILYDKFISYIKSKDISSQNKDDLLKKFDIYIDKLSKFPKGVDVIQKDIYLLLETDYSNKSDLLDMLKKEIKTIEKGKGKVRKVGEKLINKVTFGKAETKLFKLYSLRSLIETGEWIGNKDDLKVDLDNIESGSKVFSNYNQRVSGIDFGVEFGEMKDSGKEFFERSQVIKKLVFGDDIPVGFDKLENLGASKKTEQLLGIENYVKYILSNDLEKDAGKNIDFILKKIDLGEITFKNEDDFYKEINKILQGKLSKAKALDELGKVKIEKLSDESKIKINDLFNIIKNGFDDGESIYITEKELKEVIIELKNGIDFDFYAYKGGVDIVNLRAITESLKELHNYDYNDSLSSKNSLYEIKNSLKIKYKDEISYFKILNKINGTNLDLEIEFNKFSDSIFHNNYSNGQAKTILEKLFAGEKFSSINLEDIIKNTSDHSEGFNMKQKLIDNLDLRFDSLDDLEKKDLLKFIENNKDIDKNILPKTIKDALGLEIDNIRTSIDSFKKEFKEGINEIRKGEIRKGLDDLLKINGIDAELIDEINNLKSEINASIDDLDVKNSTKEVLSPKEKIEKIKNFFEVYDRAIKEAELLGDKDLAERINKTKTEDFDFYRSNQEIFDKLTVKEQESLIKARFNLGEIRAKNTLDGISNKFNDLVDKGILELKDGTYHYVSGKTEADIPKFKGFSKFIKYIGKAFKTGG